MHELDKRKFGDFVSSLRKEKGLTQKQLAQKLYISDKAISKWETGITIPDTCMLIPLSEVLGVTVTELLKGKRIDSIDKDSEEIVKTAISLRSYNDSGFHKTLYIIVLLIEIILTAIVFRYGKVSVSIIVNAILSTIFGAYFCFFARMQLPEYYDHYKISFIQDGFVRINVPGVYFNNRNWPLIVKMERIVMLINMIALPLLSIVAGNIAFWPNIEIFVMLTLMLGGIFTPIIYYSRKYK